MEEDTENVKEKEKYEKVKTVQKTLFSYPIATVVIYLFICLSRMLTFIGVNQSKYGEDAFVNVAFTLFSIGTNLRGFVFGLVYLFAEDAFREEFLVYLYCKCFANKFVNDETIKGQEVPLQKIDNEEDE